MPEENKNRMDELLRKYARQRREGARFDIHPATRRMLQDEVKRVYGIREGGGSEVRKSWIAMFWPHLAAAMTVALLLALAIGLFRPENPELAADTTRQAEPQRENLSTSTALSESGRGSKDLSLSMPQVEDIDRRSEAVTVKVEELEREQKRFYAQEPESRLGLGADFERKEADVLLKEKQTSEAERTLIAPSTPAPVVVLQKGPEEEALERTAIAPTGPVRGVAELYDAKIGESVTTPGATSGVAGAADPSTLAFSRAREQTPALQPTVATPAATARAVADLEKMNNLGAALRRDFVVVTNGAVNVQRPANSLWATSFQMEQLGEQVRFSDESGSTFVGELQPAPRSPIDYFALESKSRAIPAIEAATNSPVPPGHEAYYFRATGVNRTLGKTVVFEGQLFDPTNNVQSPPGPGPVTLQRRVRGGAGTAVPTIVGRVVVDGTNAVPLRAVSPER